MLASELIQVVGQLSQELSETSAAITAEKSSRSEQSAGLDLLRQRLVETKSIFFEGEDDVSVMIAAPGSWRAFQRNF